MSPLGRSGLAGTSMCGESSLSVVLTEYCQVDDCVADQHRCSNILLYIQAPALSSNGALWRRTHALTRRVTHARTQVYTHAHKHTHAHAHTHTPLHPRLRHRIASTGGTRGDKPCGLGLPVTRPACAGRRPVQGRSARGWWHPAVPRDSRFFSVNI